MESTGGHTVWAERYDRDLHNVFELQDEIARSIARALKIKLSPKEEDAIARGRVVNAEAYDCYLRGRRLLRRGTKRDVQSAAHMFEQAVGIDAHFALVVRGHWACGPAESIAIRIKDPEWMKKGIQACEQALDLEPHLPEELSAALARVSFTRTSNMKSRSVARGWHWIQKRIARPPITRLARR